MRGFEGWRISRWSSECSLRRDNAALQVFFCHSLSDTVKDELACRDPPDSLDELINLINLSIHLDNRICERRREREVRNQRPLPRTYALPLLFPKAPFRLGSALQHLLSLPRSLWSWLVHTCPPPSDNAGSKLVSTSFVVPPDTLLLRAPYGQKGSSVKLGVLMRRATSPNNPQTRLLVTTTLSHRSVSLPLQALVDSGAEHNLL
ncbi:uncharacterized protein [Channa argus]|uniref:uncharacterized protein n=1 Tax=Channa argus TaxID=215402 RepID=UPI003522A04F